MITLEFLGLEDFFKRLTGVPDRLMTAAGAAIYREAEDVMTESKELVPVDQGPLRDSGHVELPVFEGNEVSVTMGYGGAAQDYATVQHEDESLKHPGGGEAKFLLNPLLRRVDGMAERIAEEIAHDLGAE